MREPSRKTPKSVQYIEKCINFTDFEISFERFHQIYRNVWQKFAEADAEISKFDNHSSKLSRNKNKQAKIRI